MGRALIVSAIHGERYGISSSRWVIPLIFHQNSCVVLEQPKYLYLPPTPVQLIFSTLWLLTLSAEIHRRNFRGLTKVYCGQCRFGGFLEELSSKQGLRAPAEIPLTRSIPCPAGGRGEAWRIGMSLQSQCVAGSSYSAPTRVEGRHCLWPIWQWRIFTQLSRCHEF